MYVCSFSEIPRQKYIKMCIFLHDNWYIGNISSRFSSNSEAKLQENLEEMFLHFLKNSS